MKIRKLKANQTEITLDDGTQVFVSYETAVAAFVPGVGWLRTERKWSPTTTRHVNKWLEGVRANYQPQEYFDCLLERVAFEG